MKIDILSIPCSACPSYGFCKEYEQKNASAVNADGVWVGVMSPIRKCLTVIADKHYRQIKNKRILEVGCGSSRKDRSPKSIFEENGCSVTALDIVETDKTDVVGDVCKLPFEDSSFDVVIGNQTLEHWHDAEIGLTEIHRVLKDGGVVHLNVPIHLHGNDLFVKGEFDNIGRLFCGAGFEVVVAESYRAEPGDLDRYASKKIRRDLNSRGFKYDPQTLTAYIVHFILRKQDV
jgi:ubiquinone/menaquinone biosynthesis C-methylase UbiE